MSDVSIRTLILEFVDSNGASHIREMQIEILHCSVENLMQHV